MSSALHLYSDLSRWWPLVSPVEDYAEEAAEFERVVLEAMPTARTVLELGSGGGSNAYYLKRRFALTLTDLSQDMLDVSRALNPECEHLRADMRSLALDRTFDVVFAHDAIDYMTTEADLAAAIATAHRHVRPGGIALFVPDAIAESFAPCTDCGGSDGPDGEGIRFLEWTHDTEPGGTIATTHYTFVIRERDGSVRTLTEAHHLGVFPESTWLDLLEQAGFAAQGILERTTELRGARTLFLCRHADAER